MLSKVRANGAKDRAGFDQKIKAAYGAELTDEVVDQLFLVFNTVARANPDFMSKAKQTGKYNSSKKKNREADEQHEQEYPISGPCPALISIADELDQEDQQSAEPCPALVAAIEMALRQ